MSNGEQIDDLETLDDVDDILDETYENGILIPYYHTGYGQYFIDK